MATGLGARRTNDDALYFVEASHNDYVTGGRSAGPILIPFLSSQDNNLDATSAWVWGITVAAIVIVLGIHVSFGGNRLL